MSFFGVYSLVSIVAGTVLAILLEANNAFETHTVGAYFVTGVFFLLIPTAFGALEDMLSRNEQD